MKVGHYNSRVDTFGTDGTTRYSNGRRTCLHSAGFRRMPTALQRCLDAEVVEDTRNGRPKMPADKKDRSDVEHYSA